MYFNLPFLSFFCGLCSVTKESEDDFNTHVSSKRHLKAVAAHDESEDFKDTHEVGNFRFFKNLFFQQIIIMYPVMEPSEQDGQFCLRCTLCNKVSWSQQDVEKHVAGGNLNSKF